MTRLKKYAVDKATASALVAVPAMTHALVTKVVPVSAMQCVVVARR